jgi:hypothetical protein
VQTLTLYALKVKWIPSGFFSALFRLVFLQLSRDDDNAAPGLNSLENRCFSEVAKYARDF